MGDSTIEQMIDREKMKALASGVRRARNEYEDDLDDLTSGLRSAGYRSYVANALYGKMYSTLSKRSVSNDFDSVIGRINTHT